MGQLLQKSFLFGTAISLILSGSIVAQNEKSNSVISSQEIEPFYFTIEFGDFGQSRDWEIENGTYSITSENYFSGIYSFKIEMYPDEDSLILKSNDPFPVAPEQEISYRVWVPEDTSNLLSIAPFFEYNSVHAGENDLKSHTSNIYSADALEPASWNELIIEVPEYQALLSFGLQVTSKSSEESLPALYVDFITSNPNALPFSAFLEPISNLRMDSIGTTYVALSWDESEETGLSHYKITRRVLHKSSFSIIDSTTNTYYIDQSVQSATNYSYAIFPVDTLGKIAFSTTLSPIETPAFPENLTWDFESGVEGWSNTSSSIESSNVFAYSANHSILIAGNENTPEFSFHLSDDLESLQSGQTIFYHIRINQESIDLIENFHVYYKYGVHETFESEIYSVSELSDENWNKISVQIPTSLPADSLKEIGLRVNKTESSANPSFHIDLITTDPNEVGTSILSPPSNPQIEFVGYRQAVVSWSPSQGIGHVTYSLELIEVPDNPFGEYFPPFEMTDTVNTFYHLVPSYPYRVNVSTIDETGKTTETISIDFTTKAIENYPLYDFENGMEGWHASSGTSELSNERAFSGLQSVKFNTEADTAIFQIVDDDFISSKITSIGDLQIAHELTYRVWISDDDIANIDQLQLFAQDGTPDPVWFSKVIQMEEIEPNKWNEISFIIPEEIENLIATGLSVTGNEEGVNPEVVIFIDFITTQEVSKILPNLSTPSNLKIESTEDHSVTLYWSPSSGKDSLQHYVLYRGGADAEDIEDFHPIANTKDTVYTDREVRNGYTIRYRVSAKNLGGLETHPTEYSEVMVGVGLETENQIPDKFDLAANYPNPFNPSTIISYQLPVNSQVSLVVFDMLGRQVATLVDGEHKTAGPHTVTFDAGNLASGMYFYRMEAGSFSKVQRMMLIK